VIENVMPKILGGDVTEIENVMPKILGGDVTEI